MLLPSLANIWSGMADFRWLRAEEFYNKMTFNDKIEQSYAMSTLKDSGKPSIIYKFGLAESILR